jgi:hypothetical protein
MKSNKQEVQAWDEGKAGLEHEGKEGQEHHVQCVDNPDQDSMLESAGCELWSSSEEPKAVKTLV